MPRLIALLLAALFAAPALAQSLPSSALQGPIGGPFVLIDQAERRVTERDFLGRYLLVYFGYTYCPDICPTELATMTAALDDLGDAAKDVVPVFITVDPERDTPAQLKDYAALFHPRLVALTGTPAQVRAAARAYRVTFAKYNIVDAGDYQMDHSSFVYLMGPDGRFIAAFAHGTPADTIAESLKLYTNRKPQAN